VLDVLLAVLCTVLRFAYSSRAGDKMYHLAAGLGLNTSRKQAMHAFRLVRAPQTILARSYASESEQFKHSYAGPPPPAPRLPKKDQQEKESLQALQSLQSPSAGITSISHSSASSSSSSAPNSSGSSAPSSSSASTTASSDAGNSESKTAVPHRPLDSHIYPKDLPASFGINQHAAGVTLFQAEDPQLQRDLDAIVQEFRAPIRYAFAYGSGVFKQKGYSEKVCNCVNPVL
jgi:translocator assembly and maintenance protein 41